MAEEIARLREKEEREKEEREKEERKNGEREVADLTAAFTSQIVE